MTSLARFVLVGCALASFGLASAQSTETANVTTSARRRAAAPAPASTVHNSGSAKTFLVPFGPFISQTGVGGGGANVSELYTTFTLGAVGYNIFGYGMQSSLSISVADDFTVPAGQIWTVSSVKWLSYQTGAATTGTITSMNLNLWNSNPTGQLPGGQSTTGPANAWASNTFTGVYRVADNGLTAINRAIIQVTCGGAWIPVLGPGTYWLEASAGGTLTSGPWASVKVVAGQTPPTGAPWNGVQSISAGAFAPVYDTGNPAGSINEAGDFLVQIEGTGSSACNVTYFCTSKTSSLGCVPLLTPSSSTASKAGVPPSNLTAAPVPGGAGLPGILIYSKISPSPPIATNFGFLCLSPFQRAGAFPASPGGTPGTCTGVYTWNLSAIAVGTPSILVGDVLRIQAWYRDPPNPGGANFTHGVDGITIVPSGGGCAPPPPPTPPIGSTISPTSGGAGTVVTVTGNNFGAIPSNLKLLLANGIGCADVSSASGTSLTATVFDVGNTGTGPVTVIRGTGRALPNQSSSVGGITSNSASVHALNNGVGSNFGSFTLSPGSVNTVSASSGSPLAGGLSLDMTGLSGIGLRYRLTIKSSVGAFAVYQGQITFVGAPSPAQRASHLADHLNQSFGSLGVSASASGTFVRISTAGAAYTGIVVAGI